MLAVDTNVLIRFLTQDDAVQSARARRLLENEETFVSLTVVLETAWVLNRFFRYDRMLVAVALESIASLPLVEIETPERLAIALDLSRRGMDFADAIHLAAATPFDAMITFDRDFIGRAARLQDVPVREP